MLDENQEFARNLRKIKYENSTESLNIETVTENHKKNRNNYEN